jgi:hypothetical protein
VEIAQGSITLGTHPGEPAKAIHGNVMKAQEQRGKKSFK